MFSIIMMDDIDIASGYFLGPTGTIAEEFSASRVVAFEEELHKIKLSLRQADVSKALAEDEALSEQGGCVPVLEAATPLAEHWFAE